MILPSTRVPIALQAQLTSLMHSFLPLYAEHAVTRRHSKKKFGVDSGAETLVQARVPGAAWQISCVATPRQGLRWQPTAAETHMHCGLAKHCFELGATQVESVHCGVPVFSHWQLPTHRDADLMDTQGLGLQSFFESSWQLASRMQASELT